MPKKKQTPDFLTNIEEFTDDMVDNDDHVEQQFARERGHRSSVSFDSIKKRAVDTRGLNEQHVHDLTESITSLGLIEPLVTDVNYVILAGGHRLAAIEHLRLTDLERFYEVFPHELIPIRVMPFDSQQEPEKALQIEIAENEHRRDYTPSEVRNIANHLREQGYKDSGGRPKKGEKALLPALGVVVGKSKSTILRYLKEEKEGRKKTVPDDTVFLRKASIALKKWGESDPSDTASQALKEKLPEMLELIETALKTEEKNSKID